ncbi:putative sodium-coupled neutral amino acid transporter 7 isoform X2 [Daphnia pulicaria]|uniref:putative sodium-coupled neutral amino acid transporter 7 isoform X2 n=1 Tax=Daphnia pulicaria TaxID=35523 RepID=UPI001EEA6DBB|nr:putative sodium-coupled neutral amino acid transporter 7 isoform X2 [Daphnia pulicaria]
MASVIEDAETYQQSGLIVPSFNLENSNDLVPLTNPASDVTTLRRTSALGSASRGTSNLGTVFLIVNAALGAGLLNFPKAFDQAGGIEVALVVQAILVVFVIASLLILAKCSDVNGAETVQAALHGASGKIGQNIGSFCVALYSFGTCITFLIIIGDQFDRALASLYGPNFCSYWYMQREFLIPASSIIFILPLCFSLRIDFLKYVSPVGVLSIVYVVGLIAYEYFEGGYVPGLIKESPDSWTDVFLVVPVICFGYQCHVSAVPIYSCMKERTVKRFSVCMSSAIFICFIAYTVAATFGYLTFGSNVPSDILQAYDASQPHVLIAIVALAAKSCATYPILAFCGREALMSVAHDCGSASSVVTGQHREKWGRILIAITWFTCSLMLAVLIPDIGQVIQILGSLAAVFIFVFPGICLLQVTLRQDPSMIRRKNLVSCLFACAIIVVGVFLFGLVLTQAIRIDIATASSERPSQFSPLCNVTQIANLRLVGG